MTQVSNAMTISDGPAAEQCGAEPQSSRRWNCWDLAILVLAVFHTVCCWRLFGAAEGLTSPTPILVNDYTFNYYYAVRARDTLAASGTTAAYDPNFMAGYAKSILFPSSATYVEIVVALFGGSRPATVFKSSLFLAVASLPWLLWLTASILRSASDSVGSAERRRFACAAAVTLALAELFFWSDWGLAYVWWGMVPFVFSASLTLLAAALGVRFLDSARFGWWLATALTAALTCMIHLCSPIVLFPAFAWAAAHVARRWSWKRQFAFWSLPVVIFLFNAFWIVPGLLMLATLETTATGIGFINPNVAERFAEFLVDRPMIELVILLCAPVGLYIGKRRVRPGASILAVTLMWTFFMAYPGGMFRVLDPLQPARYSLYVFLWGALPAGWAVAELLDLARRKCSWLPVSATLVAALAIAFVVEIHEDVRPVLKGEASLPTEFTSLHHRLFAKLKQRFQPGDRVLFESRNRGAQFQGNPVQDPLGDFRLAPLIPLETGATVIGGPYLYTHLTTNFTQFGDGMFMGKTNWNAEQFEQYVRLYDLSWIVCWSPFVVHFCSQHPELVEIVDVIGGRFVVGRIVFDREDDEKRIRRGRARITHHAGRLQIDDIAPEDGLVVLPYHWVPHLSTRPPVQLEMVRLLDDPVPFIALRDPPVRCELYLDLYRAFSP